MLVLWALMACDPLTVEADPGAVGFRIDATCNGNEGAGCIRSTVTLTADANATLRPLLPIDPGSVVRGPHGARFGPGDGSVRLLAGVPVEVGVLACVVCGADAPETPPGRHYGAAVWFATMDDGTEAGAVEVPLLLVVE